MFYTNFIDVSVNHGRTKSVTPIFYLCYRLQIHLCIADSFFRAGRLGQIFLQIPVWVSDVNPLDIKNAEDEVNKKENLTYPFLHHCLFHKIQR